MLLRETRASLRENLYPDKHHTKIPTEAYTLNKVLRLGRVRTGPGGTQRNMMAPASAAFAAFSAYAAFAFAAAAAAAPPADDPPWPLTCRAGDAWNAAKCPASATCAPMMFSATRTGCCPWPNATACAGSLECCPAGTACVATGNSPPYGAGTYMCLDAARGANVSVSKAPCKPGPSAPMNATLKNVLIIGDSVSIGYLGWVAYLLQDIALVQHAPWEYLPGQGGDRQLDAKPAGAIPRTTGTAQTAGWQRRKHTCIHRPTPPSTKGV